MIPMIEDSPIQAANALHQTEIATMKTFSCPPEGWSQRDIEPIVYNLRTQYFPRRFLNQVC